MQPDLVGLEFTKGELKRLTGVNPDDVLRLSIWQNREKRLSFLSNELIKIFVPTVIIVGLIYTFIIRTIVGASIVGAIALCITFIIIAFGRWIWQQKIYPQPLKRLLDNVDRYHSVIHDVNILDEAELSINVRDSNERTRTIQALQQLREDLVQALQGERNLRDKKNLVGNILIADTSSFSPAISTGIQTNEYAPIVNALLQISSNVQAEVRKLQAQLPK